MKIRKLLSLMLAAALTCGMLCSCAPGTENPTDPIGESTAPSQNQTEPNATEPSDTEPSGTETTEPTQGSTEPTVPPEPPKLSSITVDGGYSLSFDPDVYAYTVTIPAGRPRVPHVSATAADGVSVTVLQATISDTQTSGKAVITVDNGSVSTYTVEFVKDAAQGFQLQYADVYTYVPNYTLKAGESFTFKSSNTNVISVKKSGKMTVKATSDQPVTITASVGGVAVDKLVIDKVIKAPLNIFLILGQSNAFGWHDVPAGYDTYYDYANTQKAISDKPAKGTVFCDDVSNGYDDYTFTGMYDLSIGRSGFSPALGKQWYALTGEKTLMLQTAIGSTPIEAWTPDPALKFYGLDCYAITVERFNYYKELLSKEDSNYEINRVYGFWVQGESGMEYVYSSKTFTWAFKHDIPNYEYIGDWLHVTAPGQIITSKQYDEYFFQMVNGLQKDVGLEFLGVLPVRAMMSVSTRENRTEQTLVDIVPTRAAQFAMNYKDYDHVAFMTLKTEIARTESYADKTVEGWGWMGCNNIHYNQLGYNALGKDVADNTFAKFNGGSDKTATSLVVLDSNGRTQLKDGDELKISLGEKHQITGYVLPLYADNTGLTFTVADTSVCTIDEFGMITVPNTAQVAGKSTTLTVSSADFTVTLRITIAR